MEAKKLESKERIQANLEAARRAEERRKMELRKQQMQVQRLRERNEAKRRCQLERKKQKIRMLEQRRAYLLQVSRNPQEAAKADLINKFVSNENSLAALEEERRREQQLERERKEIEDVNSTPNTVPVETRGRPRP